VGGYFPILGFWIRIPFVGVPVVPVPLVCRYLAGSSNPAPVTNSETSRNF
jgi:hypothetical protein